MTQDIEIPNTLRAHLEENYVLESELGRGGMGVVYLATDRRLDRQVAIKVLNISKVSNEELATEITERFQREAKVVARLSHPNLVTVFDVGSFSNYHYMIMEYAKGKTLSDLIEAGQKLPPVLAASLGKQVCDALAVAHEEGVIHRDIKPGNIILSDKGVAKLTDFGIAQLNQQDQQKLTQAGSMMGSILYASPEQVKDASQVDKRTDLYSLGVTLYELLSNASPYASEQLSQIILEIMSPGQSPKPLQEHDAEIPEALSLVIQKAMSKSLEDRFQSAEEMSRALGQLMSAETAIAPIQLEFTQSSGGGGTTSVGNSTMIRRTQINEDTASTLRKATDWVLPIIHGWHKEDLSHLNLEQVIQKVTEKDLLGNALSGAVVIDNRFCLLIYQGLFVGAIDREQARHGHHVFDHLPEDSDRIHLHIIQSENALTPLVISNILEEKGQILQNRLDSSLVDVVPLVESFGAQHEALTGYVVCLAQNNVYYYAFVDGEQIFEAQAQPDTAAGEDWKRLTQLVLKQSMLIHVYGIEPELMGPSQTALLKNSRLDVSYVDPEKVTLQQLLELNDELPVHMVREAKSNLNLTLHSENNPVLQVADREIFLNQQVDQSQHKAFANWLLRDYFFLLNSSGNANSLKYIYSWLPAIERFELKTELMGADGNSRTFSLAARGTIPGESAEKVLLLVRIGDGEASSVEQFIDDVIQVKTHLIKQGDIGGALYVSTEQFSTEGLKLFSQRTVEPRKKGFGLGALDKLTRYKGFVRIGMKRGFHLNLIEAHSQEQYEPIAPLLK